MATLEENLKFFREKENITKSELARRINVSPAYITLLEKGEKKKPSLEVLINLAKALNISYADLIKDTELESEDKTKDLIKFSDMPKSERVAFEDFLFDNPDTFRIINFLESHGYSIKYNEDLNEVTIISEYDGNDIIINVDDFTDFDSTLKKLLDYTQSVADKFVNDIAAQYKK